MTDTVTKQKRTEIMRAVRSRGNRSTEIAVEAALRHAKIRGWCKHPEHIPGHPDFYFASAALTVFVDGCFWHGCPRCARNVPRTNRSFWRKKIIENRLRDARLRRKLNRLGLATFRIWEHQIRKEPWLNRLKNRLVVCLAVQSKSRQVY
jgi:DNA mismatch endonuclease (patch repair protein)